jgi:hypothetical protein
MTRPPNAPPPPRRRLCLQWGAGLLLAPLWPGLSAQPAAAPAARLRLSLERDEGRLEVGQAIVVRLEAWVSTWFLAPVDFPATLAAEGALVEAVGGSPDSRFEDFDGRRWTGLIRRYRILPLQPGEISVALAAPLQVMPGGGTGRPQPLSPPAPLRLSVRLPAGAEDIQPFVAARRLELRQRWWPEAGTGAAPLQVGDLVRREIVLVTDSTSPLLPAPDFGTPPGVDARVQAAEVQEQRADAAASPTLTRRHEATYTLQHAGRVALPAVELVWWDLTQRKRRVTRLDGLQLEVRPAANQPDPFAAAAPELPPAQQEGGATWRRSGLMLAALGVAGALGLGVVAMTRHRSRTRASDTSRRPSRPRILLARWRLMRACLRDDAPAADAALRQAWAALPAGTQQRWLQDREFAQASAALARHRFGPSDPSTRSRSSADGWDGAGLWRACRRLRRSERASTRAALPTLHP